MSHNPDMDAPPPEKVLIAKAQAGDANALEELLAAHQDRIYRTALGLAGDEEAARELAQEVLVSAFRHIGQFRGASKFSTWLYRMTVNFSKNRAVARGRHRARFVSMEDPIGVDGEERSRFFPDEAVSPRERAVGAEMMTRLEAELAALRVEYRDAMVLRYIEDRSYEEIAEILSVPIGTVKSRINRGRRELRIAMKDVFGGDTP